MANEKISYSDFVISPSLYYSNYGENDHWNCVWYKSHVNRREYNDAIFCIRRIHYFYTIETSSCLRDAFEQGLVKIHEIMDYYDKVDFTLFRDLCHKYKDELDNGTFDLILDALIEKKDLNGILSLTGLDGVGKLSANLNVEKIVRIHDVGCRSEILDELYKNYELLKEQNKGINPDNPEFSMILLNSDFQSKFSPKFISDVIEYYGGMSSLIRNKDDYAILNLERFLKDNGLYSKKMVHKVLSHYIKNKELFDNLTRLERLLDDIEIRNLVRYIDGNGLAKIKNIKDLHELGDKIVSDARIKFRDEENVEKLKGIVYMSLFGYSKPDRLIELYQNKYLQQRMRKMGLLEVEDEALLSIVNEIETMNEDNIELFKKKFNNIIIHNLDLYKTYSKLDTKIKNYYLSKLSNEGLKSKYGKGNTSSVEFEGKEIPVYELNGENFCFTVHGIGYGNDETVKKKNIVDNPSLWNEIDMVSSISTSLISDKYFKTITQPKILLGFVSLPQNSLINMSNTDGLTEHGYNVFEPDMAQGDVGLTSPQRLIKKTANGTYNEVAFYRKNSSLSEHQGKIQPDFIVCKDIISEQAKKFAAYFGVPIVVIKTEIYQKQAQEKVEKYKSGSIDNFTVNDAREILELKELTEEESLELIMRYLSKIDLATEPDLVDEIKNIVIDYYISEPKRIDIILKSIDQIVEQKNNMEVDNNARHK